MPANPRILHRVAIVGASSLLGKELKQVLEDRHFPASDIILLDTTVMAGTLTEAGGEPTFVRALAEDSFDGVRVAFFAGRVADAEQNWAAAQRAGATVVDLTGALAATGTAMARIPALDAVLPPLPSPSTSSTSALSKANAGGGGAPAADVKAYTSPSAAVIIACTMAAGLEAFRAQRVAILMFPPVSERDEAGIEELENQTARLLSFRQIAQPVFGAQVAFNLMTSYGEGSKSSLEDTREAIARDVARYIAGRGRAPALQLVQAPVFYGYAFSVYADLGASPPPEAFAATFAKLGVKVNEAGEAAPTNISVAGESEIQMASARTDPNVTGAIWLWGAADNLRVAATNAVRIAEELVAKPVA
jgi:aspartate-semialdehyde dehydrogenase